MDNSLSQSRTPRWSPRFSRRFSLRNPFRYLDALFLLLAWGALKRTYRDAENYAEDFHVYWKAAHTWLAGGDPYAFTAADLGFVFKYPPPILPLFLPLGALDWDTARRVWFGTEVFCVWYAMRWCVRQGVPLRVAAFVACLFWWMFHAHFAAGQFTLVILLVSLWAWPADIQPQDPASLKTGSGFREGALAFILSAKVFSLLTLAGIWRRYLRPGPWAWAATLVIASHLLLLAVSRATGHLAPGFAGALQALEGYYRGFMLAAASGGSELGAEIVRGQGNHGFTALVLRTSGASSLSFAYDMTTSAALALLLGSIWRSASQDLTEAERWAGWIGIGLVVHPLAWHHSFVLAYPLCALAMARALRVAGRRRRRLVALAVLGACCIGIFIPQVLGKTIVKPIELAGIKSWGVVLSGVALWLSARARGAAAPSRRPVP